MNKFKIYEIGDLIADKDVREKCIVCEVDSKGSYVYKYNTRSAEYIYTQDAIPWEEPATYAEQVAEAFCKFANNQRNGAAIGTAALYNLLKNSNIERKE